VCERGYRERQCEVVSKDGDGDGGEGLWVYLKDEAKRGCGSGRVRDVKGVMSEPDGPAAGGQRTKQVHKAACHHDSADQAIEQALTSNVPHTIGDPAWLCPSVSSVLLSFASACPRVVLLCLARCAETVRVPRAREESDNRERSHRDVWM
jgi:hypothetical protein